MLVFIDESGDPGFKLDQGATPIFVAVMVIFEKNEDAFATQRLIESSEVRKLHKPEFKFNKCSDDIRDRFFQLVRASPFLVRSIVVRKEKIHSPKLKSDKETFYEYFVKSMLKYDANILRDAKVIIDGSGDREFRQTLSAALRRRLGPGAIKEIRFKDSRKDVLVQLADMCAGAIARSYRRDRPHPERWRRMLAPRLNDVWDFE